MDNIKVEIKKEKSFKPYWVLDIILIICVLFIFMHYVFSAPVGSRDRTLHISSSDSLIKISQDLRDNNIIKSPYIFKTLMFVLSKDKNIHYGDYLFKGNSSVLDVSLQIAKGKHGVAPIKITLTEGMTNEDMAKLLADKLPVFRSDAFLSDPRSKQGYLFPDTYFFYPLTTTNEVLEEMTADFKKRISGVNSDISSSGKSLSDIIVMASIIEKEASGKNDSSIISGILWKRIKLGMPLQVDASPSTYKVANLPNSPISNPGLLAINSALHPEDSPYLFYLHDKNGLVHYATDFNQHKINIARYLK
ncbi:MAG: endolytic transglycosylase MltG [Candidatus Nomurabacteria bacterium]